MNGNEGLPKALQYKVSMAFHPMGCRRQFPIQQSAMINANHLCSISGNESGTCYGDAGGPVVNTLGRLIGIVSWAISCGNNIPDVHTRVFPELNFIRYYTGIGNR